LKCPCDHKQPLVPREGRVDYFCEFVGCPLQSLNKIAHFASRGCMDIDSLGLSTVKDLVDANLVTNIADIYDLKDKR
jgi:DNA ligase (NAD+)